MKFKTFIILFGSLFIGALTAQAGAACCGAEEAKAETKSCCSDDASKCCGAEEKKEKKCCSEDASKCCGSKSDKDCESKSCSKEECDKPHKHDD